MSTSTRASQAIRRRARSLGIQTSYVDQAKRRVNASTEGIAALVELLERRHLDAPPAPAVVVLRGATTSPLLLDETLAHRAAATVTVHEESGERRTVALGDLLERRDGRLWLDLSSLELPIGYHEVELPSGSENRVVVLVAPDRLRPGAVGVGLFQPIYGLRCTPDRGIGGFSELARLGRAAQADGCGFVATLPCHAVFLDEPIDPSPYLPISRLAWNELYVDASQSVEFQLLDESERPSLDRPGSSDRVEYANVARSTRAVLSELAARLAARGGARAVALEEYLRRRPETAAYARFRSRLDRSDPEESFRYHAYAQFLADEQLATVSETVRLYLDVPVGVHPRGFDVANWPQCFLAGAGVGAPPDLFYAEGQQWGFLPPDPVGARADRYRYLAASYARLLEYASVLRLDHVMGMDRLWVVPDGFSARDGAYLSYPSDELYAVVLIEAHRSGATVVGEDLGTVPVATTRSMDRSGLLHSALYRFEGGADRPLPRIRRDAIVSFATHDLARFASFCAMSDLTGPEARAERAQWLEALRNALGAADEVTPSQLYRAVMEQLATQGPSGLLVDLGDCLGDEHAENHPGTVGPENWTHRMLLSLDELEQDEAFHEMLASIASTWVLGRKDRPRSEANA